MTAGWGLEPLQRESMSSTLSNARYERKFVADGFRLPTLLAMVRRHPAGFREAYPARVVNNVYLDTPSLSAYHAHVNGAANRCKTRIRWYGDFTGGVRNATLERKLKRGLISGKEADILPAFPVNGDPARRCVESAIEKASLPGALRLALLHLEPSLLNRYHRYYFVSGDGRYRLTVDSGLEFAGPHSPTGLADTAFVSIQMLVLELKFALEQAEGAEMISGVFPFRLARCSKYVLGIERVGPG
jgi:hypothetical protein